MGRGRAIAQRAPAGADDIRAVQALASRLWPMGWHPGGLGWALARNKLAQEVVIFDDADGLAGWAALDQPGSLLAQLDPSRPEAATQIVEWFLDAAEGLELSVEVMDGDDALSGALDRRGFRRAAEAGPVCGMSRPALARAPSLPGGYTVRCVQAAETSARVEVHRAAWLPASLPWHPEHRPRTEPGATSDFNERAYEAVRRTWLYDPELDLVAVDPDGNLAACCIAWFDPTTGVAEIEPLGVVPEHRRRGLAGALCREVAARVGATGGREVFINTAPDVAYPASSGAYAKAGFEVVTRGSTYRFGRR
jgi:ribosomal protein S18 acetylase RimI-like enzyme